MKFYSVLFDRDNLRKETPEQPDFFNDLNLDQVIDAITARKQEYDLKPLFFTPLQDVETVYYRHEIMRDLEDSQLMATVNAFAEKMVIARRYLGMVAKLDFVHHRQGWFLEAVLLYCAAVAELVDKLGG